MSLPQADVIHTIHEVHIPQAHAHESKFKETVKTYKQVNNQVSGKAEYVSNIGAHSNGAGEIVWYFVFKCTVSRSLRPLLKDHLS